jgi:methionine synthase I (cobalamin-dependent)
MRRTSRRVCLEELNLSAPGVVRSVHAGYRRAGADVITTNTFGANDFRLAETGFAERMGEINRSGVRLARHEAGGRLVAGSIGPTGLRDLPGHPHLRAAFRMQAATLSSEGVDLFVCETFGDIEELCCAILGIRDVSDRPIVAHMTYGSDARTPLGLEPPEVVARFRELPVDAIGVNCAVGEGTTERVTALLRIHTSLPIVAQPIAGKPTVHEGQLRYPLDPGAFAALTTRLAATASHIGGCCGTTPRHIRAARIALGAESA